MSALPTDAARPALEAAGELARQLRVDSIRSVASAGSGHPTSSLSAADLMAVLFVRHLHYDWSRPDRPDNDHLIFSKGHASPLLYALYKAVGVDRRPTSCWRPTGGSGRGCRATPPRRSPGSTSPPARSGRGCPIGVGVALAGKRLDRLPLPRLGALRGQRDGRGLDVGGPRQGVATTSWTTSR